MSLYSEAAAAIKDHREERQGELDTLARRTREDHIKAVRRDLRMRGPSAEAKVRNLLADTITIGRADGYPQYSIPAATKATIRAAEQAGVIRNYDFGCVRFHSDFSGCDIKHEKWYADFEAWRNAKEYRENQTQAL